MPITSPADLIALLRQLHLLENKQLDELTRQSQGKRIEPRALAQLLIERGWLTPYQVNQLLQGRGPQLLLGSYLLLERLGEGGMGEVFKARHLKMDRVVAIKLIRKERLANEAAIKRFHREIRSAAQLSHPNVVHALDADQVGSTHLFAMEYVAGIDLYKLVKEKGPVSVERACTYIRQAALGLQHAFEKGMVHRDIKPHNLLLATGGEVKILDFGLARMAADDDSSTLTQEGSMMGTLDYVAPEQARDSHAVDIRADLYSLGCTFYFLLTGQPPFSGGEALEKLYKHGFEEAPPVEQLRRDVPPGVAAVVRKLLAKKPERRFQTPAELAALLAKGAAVPVRAVQTPARPAAIAAGRGIGIAAPLAIQVAADNTIVLDATPRDVPVSDRRRRPLLLIGTGGALLCGLAALLVIVLLPRSKGDKDAKAGLMTSTPTKNVEGTLENKLGMKLKRIPAGTLVMGSSTEEIERAIKSKQSWASDESVRAEGPQHEVEISQPFYTAIHEVTRGQFRQFVKDSGTMIPKGASRHLPTNSWPLDDKADWDNPGFEQDDHHPVTCVNWDDAMAFIKWLNEKHPLAPSAVKAGEQWQYALPTEAQWEHACRAATKTRYSCGDTDESLKGFANVADIAIRRKLPNTDWARWAVSWDDSYPFTAPVGAFKPNGWGLHNMHGNVWQWCADAYDANYYKDSPRRDPPGPGANGHRVLRGGSWASAPSQCRSATRNFNGSGLRRDDFGFRVVLVRVALGRESR